MNESAGNLKRETPGFYKTLMPCTKNTTPHYDFNKKCLPDYLQKFLESNIFWEENFSGLVGDVKTLCLFHLSPLLICRTNNGHTGNLEIFIDFPSNPTNKGEFLIWDTENNYPINVPLQITKTSRKKTKALTSEVSFNIQKLQDMLHWHYSWTEIKGWDWLQWNPRMVGQLSSVLIPYKHQASYRLRRWELTSVPDW